MELTADTVIVVPLDEVPSAVLAERERLGLDKRDEVWEGELHMVPSPSVDHSDLQGALFAAVRPFALARGCKAGTELGVVAPDEPGWHDYRVPDVVLCRAESATHRAIEGPVELVVEIHSPGDTAYRKLPFYARRRVGEVLIVDRRTRTVRRWLLEGAELVEQPAGEGGRHQVACVPLTLWTEGGALVVETPTTTERV